MSSQRRVPIRRPRGLRLSYVLVGVGVGSVSFHVIAIDKALDPLLQVGRFDGEFQLLVELRDQQVVRQRLPHLHNSHDRSVDLVLTVLIEKDRCHLDG